MSTEFSNIDFGFRYGNSRAVSHSDLLDGTFVIATDTGELYIDIGGIRVPMNKDIFTYNTEAEIRALLEPVPNKLYYAKDTFRLFAYDEEHLRWINAGGSPDEINERIDRLVNIINAINSFEIVIIESEAGLPVTGESHIIYLVPQPDSDDDTQYDEFLWIESESRYEKIGVTIPDLSGYYTSEQVDGLLSVIDGKVTINTNTITNLQTNLNTLSGKVDTAESNITSLGSDLDTAEGNITNIQSAIGNYNTDSSDPDYKGTISDRLDTVETASGGSAPSNHASATTAFGIGTSTLYGHVKLDDTYDQSVANGDADHGVGASQNALYNAYHALSESISNISSSINMLDFGDEDEVNND